MVSVADLIEVHSLGHLLQDVKLVFNHDMKINVADVSVESKQGEMMNLPRWIGYALAEENLAEVQESDMIVELKQALVKENVQGEFDLATLDQHFYIKLHAQMQKLDSVDFDKVESMLNSLVRKRQGKIIRLADSSKLSSETASKLTVEEKEFYNTIYDNSAYFKSRIIGGKKRK